MHVVRHIYSSLKMATKHPSGLKVPVRPAPAPPPVRSQALQFNSNVAMAPPSKAAPNLMENWDFSFDDSFPKPNESTFHSAWPDKPAGRKIPPPRPPPPKITKSSDGKNTSKLAPKQNKQGTKQASARPSDLLSNLFSRRGQKGDGAPQSSSGRPAVPFLPPVPVAVTTAPLIDLNSPPSSPTPTTRSSSDGLSVDSFGSDGTTSHSHHHSQVESGFEDDSDLFGGATATPSPIMKDPWAATSQSSGDPFFSSNTSASTPKNPWATTPQDPFSPPRKNNPVPSPTPPVPPVSVSVPGVVAFKPTIIRPKIKPNSSPSVSRSKPPAQPLPVQFDAVADDDRSESPPMPSIPPPAPPAELLAELEDKSFLNHSGSSFHGPHCIALYKFEGSHPDDLSFEENDVIELVKEVSADWLRGRLGGREGIFPANFVKVLVPLSDTGGIYATALYPFAAEAWEDLELQVGARVLLLGRIDADWLYGEYEGKQGQFPASFVDRVPNNLPLRTS